MLSKVIGLRRLAFGAAALAVGTAAVLPALSGQASAAAQVQNRYVKLSNSAGAATGVSYEVGFKAATAATVKAVVIDFCDTTPIIGDTCTLPAGFSVGATPTVATTGGSNTGLTGTWTPTSVNSNRTLVLKNATGTALSVGDQVIFTLSGVQNPTNNNHSFYARIYTFSDDTSVAVAADGTTVGTNVIDQGGTALSTAQQIDITAKVQETLTFCVYKSSCGDNPAISLGDTHGVLSVSGAFMDKATHYDIATNAANGAVIRYKGNVPQSGSNVIDSIGTTPVASSPGTNQFGMCSFVQTGAQLSVQAPYNDATCTNANIPQTSGTGTGDTTSTAKFAFDTTNGTSTYGATLADMTAGSTNTGVLAFVGNISNTKPAGIYTTSMNLIATGTY